MPRETSSRHRSRTFVGGMVRAGEFRNASEAAGDALGTLQRRQRKDAKLKTLRMQIRAGVQALDHGDCTEVDDTELDAYLMRVNARQAID